jgi:hypothetical protein
MTLVLFIAAGGTGSLTIRRSIVNKAVVHAGRLTGLPWILLSAQACCNQGRAQKGTIGQ